MTQGPGTVNKALGMLTLVGQHPRGATAGQLAEVAGYPFSTAYRLLNSLVEAGFVDYDPQDKRYRLGLRIFQLAQKVSSARGFSGTAMPILHGLTELTHESSILAVLDGDQYLTVHKVDGPQFRTTTDPGDNGDLHTSAMGKALLAFSDPPVRERLLESIELVPRTQHSITDREVLRAQVEQIRERGWADQREEHDIGMAAIAVPVLAASGRLIASVALAAPLFRNDPEGLRAHLPELRRAADELSAALPLR